MTGRSSPLPGGQRIGPPDAVDSKTADVLGRVLQAGGEPLRLFGVLAQRPGILRRYSAMGAELLFGGVLPARLRELAILRVAARLGCDYEYGHHRPMAEAAGAGAADVAAAAALGEPPGDEVERAALALVDRLCATGQVDDAVWAEAARHLEDDALVELVVLTGFYAMTAMVNNAVRMALEEGFEGFPAAGGS